jgi:AbiV family abortive infection protein
MRHPREIPKSRVHDGVDLCKKNIFIFLETAETLIKSGNLNHAAINLGFGVEEYGKILMLKDEFAKSTDPMQVPETVFKNHKNKSERAWKTGDPDSLDINYKMISEGGFERSDDGKQGFSRAFSQAIFITHFIRMECAFVDFDETEKDWFLGHSQLVKERMQSLLDHLKAKTNNVSLQ